MSQYIEKVRTAQGDLQIDYEALANLPTISNPNLLINGDFQIWQRGESFTNISNVYSADRWLIKNAVGNTSIVQKSPASPPAEPMCQSMYIKETLSENTYLRYWMEPAIKGMYTLSFWYLSTVPINTYSYDQENYVKLMQLEACSDWKRAVVTFHANAVSFINIIHAMQIGECYITGVKLEVGTTVTPFSPRPYAEELTMCQRYYVKLQSTYPLMMTQQNTAETYSYMPIWLPVSLRDVPIIRYKNVKLLKNGVGGIWFDVTSVTCVGYSKLGVSLKIDLLDSTYEVGVPYFLILPNSGYIEFDAEIY